MIAVAHQRGIELPEHRLWLDPQDSRPFSFVSHAHSDHIARHGTVIASPATVRLMRARLAGARTEHLLEFGLTVAFDDFQLTLLPAGHILGSAQCLVESERGSLLYTGDFKTRAGLSAEAVEWRHADTLIMETTFGLPRYRFPPADEVIDAIVRFCLEAMEDGEVPVLFAYSLGKAQEILCALAARGLTSMLHEAVYKLTRIYRELRPGFPDFERFNTARLDGKVLLCPPSAARSHLVRRIPKRRTAMLTGWAVDSAARFRYQCDAAFPLSDHADYNDLLRYVEKVQPTRVLTVHGFAAPFARDLRALGLEAWALGADDQLELALPAPARRARHAETAPARPIGFGRLARLGEDLAGASGRLRKIALLAEYLSSLEDTDLTVAAVYLTGRPFPQSDARTLQSGWALIRRAVAAAARIPEAELRAIARHYGDAARAAREALEGRTTPAPLPLVESRQFFDRLAEARGPMAKSALLEKLLSRLDAREGGFLVSILTGDLRIGLKEGLLEEAIAAAFSAPVADVQEANMLLGDIGEVAVLARRGSLNTASLRIFRPVKCMLASPQPDAASIAGRITGKWWAEDKLDGIRAQLHRTRGRVELYSRDLRRMTAEFPELAAEAALLDREVILDGEIIADGGDVELTFFDLQKRLGRKEADLFIGSEIPVAFVAFDILWLDGRSLMKEPLSHRRSLLETLSLPDSFERVNPMTVDSEAGIDRAFRLARQRRNEGLVVKDGSSLYTPGRRGLAWLKLKKELATLDVVVVGVETGHGKRSHVLSDYTFAVRDESTGRLLTIGKAYSGLTDQEIEELTAHFLEHTLSVRGRYREVEPDTVLEIAFDSIQPSTRHQSGLALRFPRIKRIRRDKSPEAIDTLSYAQSLAMAAQGAAVP